MKTAAASGRTARFRIQVSENHEAQCRLGAEHFVQTVLTSIEDRGRAVVALSGGTTPRALYTLLATEPYRVRVPWEHVHVFWGDERTVPPDSPDSNFKMASDALLSHVPIPATNIHRLQGEGPPVEAAALYEAEIRGFFARPEGIPVFDLIHLGMGDDGHTASLFPHTPALTEAARVVAENPVEKLATTRLTFTYPLLNAASHVVFLVSGENKKAMLQKVLEGPYTPEEHPAEGVQPASGTLLWLVDKAAAATLSSETLARR